MHKLIILILIILVGFFSYKLKSQEQFGSLNMSNIAQTLGKSSIVQSENILSKMSNKLVN
jgi:hypothetical protein